MNAKQKQKDVATNQTYAEGPTDQPPLHIPTPFDDVKIFGEMSFTHKTASGQLLIKGRVDHGVGLVLSRHPRVRRTRFESLLLAVQAKADLGPDGAVPQLAAYLASLREIRLSKNRSNASVYGVASDGYRFMFATITHDGTFQTSRTFDVAGGELGAILGCLKYLLELSGSMSPTLNPEIGGPCVAVDSDDDVLDLDDDAEGEDEEGEDDD